MTPLRDATRRDAPLRASPQCSVTQRNATALDTETCLPTNSEPVPRLVVVAYGDGDLDVAHRVEWDRVAYAWSSGVALANAPFDAFVLWRARPEIGREILDAYDAGRVFDVLTREKMISAAYGDGRESFGLGEVAKHRAGIVLDKADPWRTRYAELLGYELAQWPDDAREYAALDGIVTQRVFKYQELEGFAFDGTAHAQAHLALYAQTLRGIHTDAERVAALDLSITEKMERLAWTLMRAGLLVLEGKRKPVLKAKTAPAHALMSEWCSARGIEPVRTDPTPRNPDGLISLADKALHAARVPNDHPLIQLARYKSYRTLRTSRIPVFRRPLIRTRYDEYKKTARTGSSAPQGDTPIEELDAEQWVGGNLQNMARPDTLVNVLGFDEGEGFRECLVPPDDEHVFVVTDYPQLELRTHAQILLRLHAAGQIMTRSVLADIMNDPSRDMHCEVGAQIAGVPLASFDRKLEEHERCRQLAKPVNFGLPGGLGAQRLCDFAWSSARLEITIEQAKAYKAIWQRTLPEMPEYFRWIDSLRTGTATAGGQPLYRITIPGTTLSRTCKRNDACNFPFQGLAALIAKLSLWYLFRAGLEPSSPMFGAYQVLFVHDENVTVCRRDRAEAVAREQERLMTAAAAVYMPDVICPVPRSAILDRYGK